MKAYKVRTDTNKNDIEILNHLRRNFKSHLVTFENDIFKAVKDLEWFQMYKVDGNFHLFIEADQSKHHEIKHTIQALESQNGGFVFEEIIA